MTERAAALSSSVGASDPIIGRVINGRFKVTSFLARGGMGKVYRAEQAPLGRVCAVKVLDAHYAGDHDPEFHRRFFLEASVASKLTHPNTVTIFDYGKTEDGIYFMAMEYLEGATLHRAIREAGCFPEERVVHIARQICRALHEAHSLGAIHRDLKPANIFLLAPGDEVDFVKVLDFGLVKNIADTKDDLTQSGFFMGSPKYMAPEQIRGDRVDARADIYALGIILYEMITGKVPFDRPNSVNVLMAHVNEKAPPLRQTNPSVAVSPELEEIVARCMEKLPGDRFRSMDELLSTLKRPGSVGLLATGPLRGGESGRDVRPASDSVSGPQAVFESVRVRSGFATAADRTRTALLVARPRLDRPPRANDGYRSLAALDRTARIEERFRHGGGQRACGRGERRIRRHLQRRPSRQRCERLRSTPRHAHPRGVHGFRRDGDASARDFRFGNGHPGGDERRRDACPA